jgi:hypothetical protein
MAASIRGLQFSHEHVMRARGALGGARRGHPPACQCNRVCRACALLFQAAQLLKQEEGELRGQSPQSLEDPSEAAPAQ